jgi:hypothetical protein
MRRGVSVLDAVEGIADELYEEVRLVEARIRFQALDVYDTALEFCRHLPENCSRKSAAALIKVEPGLRSSVAFALLDLNHEKAMQQVWKAIEPHPKCAVFAQGHNSAYVPSDTLTPRGKPRPLGRG